MQILSLANQKGGCGKTTTAVNLAAALAARGERVLLVDLDPQAHATMSVGCAIEGDEATVAEVLLDHIRLHQVTYRAPGDFDLLPASEKLAVFEDAAARLIWPERQLSRALESVAEEYDHAIIDCPPRTDGVLTANALTACHTALVVVETGAFALQGALKALRHLEALWRDLDRKFHVRVVGTMFDRRTRLGRELLIGMQSQFGELLFDTAIHSSQRLREAAACGVPVQVLDPRCRATRDFDELAKEVLEHHRQLVTEAPATQAPAFDFSTTSSPFTSSELR